jgi:hypothetical protein
MYRDREKEIFTYVVVSIVKGIKSPIGTLN